MFVKINNKNIALIRCFLFLRLFFFKADVGNKLVQLQTLHKSDFLKSLLSLQEGSLNEV